MNDPIWSGLDRHTVRGVNGYYSAHGIGLPMMLAPFYYFGGVFLSQVFLSFLSALLVMYIYKTCLKAVSNMRASLAVSLILGFASLIVPYSNQIFPEIPMALILITSIYYICLKQVKSSRALFILGTLMGYSLFLKTAYAVFIIPFTIYIVGLHRSNRVKQSAAYLIPVTVLGLALMAYQETAFGNPLRTPQTFQAGNPFNGLFGLIFDRYFGLFTYSPALAISVFGISHFYRSSKSVRRRLNIVLRVIPRILLMDSLAGRLVVSSSADHASCSPRGFAISLLNRSLSPQAVVQATSISLRHPKPLDQLLHHMGQRARLRCSTGETENLPRTILMGHGEFQRRHKPTISRLQPVSAERKLVVGRLPPCPFTSDH